jgi:hypothetical protein
LARQQASTNIDSTSTVDGILNRHREIAEICRRHHIPFMLTSAVNGINIADSILLCAALVLRARRRANADKPTYVPTPLPPPSSSSLSSSGSSSSSNKCSVQ